MKRFFAPAIIVAALLPVAAFASGVIFISQVTPPGGVVVPNTLVPATVFRVQSTGDTTITGIKIKLVGSAGAGAINSVTVSGLTSGAGTSAGVNPDGTATLSFTRNFSTDESENFGVAFQTISDLTPYVGNTIGVDVTAVMTEDTLGGGFPISGTLFTIPQAGTSTGTTTPPGPQPVPHCVIGANTGVVNLGGTANLSWDSQYADQGTITDLGSVPSRGTQGVIPTPPATTYFGTFWGPGGTTTCSVIIGVNTGGGTGGGFGGTGGGVDGGTGSGGGTGGGSTGGPVNTSVPTTPSSQLVPCTGINCQFCHLAELSQRIINFLVGLSIPLAVAILTWAGFLYFTSSVVDKKEDARKWLKAGAVGFLIAISAWLVVQTLLKIILKPEYQNWNTIQCIDRSARLYTPIGQWLLSSFPSLGAPPAGPNVLPSQSTFDQRFGNYSPSCGAGYTITSDGDCYNPTTDDTKPATYSVNTPTISNPEMASQIDAACAAYNMDATACALAKSIALNESGGGSNCTTSPTGAAGCMQVLATTACTINSGISDSCGACLASRNSTSAACSPVIQTIASNPQLGVNLGIQYINDFYNKYGGSCTAIAASYYEGPGNYQRYGVLPWATGYVTKACGRI